MKRVLPCLFCLLLLSCLEKGETTGGFVAVLNPNPAPEETGSQPGGSTTAGPTTSGGTTVFSSGTVLSPPGGGAAATKEPDEPSSDEEGAAPAPPATGGAVSEPVGPASPAAPMMDNPPIAGPSDGVSTHPEIPVAPDEKKICTLEVERETLALLDGGGDPETSLVRTVQPIVLAGERVTISFWVEADPEPVPIPDTSAIVRETDLDPQKEGLQLNPDREGRLVFTFVGGATGVYRFEAKGSQCSASGKITVERKRRVVAPPAPPPEKRVSPVGESGSSPVAPQEELKKVEIKPIEEGGGGGEAVGKGTMQQIMDLYQSRRPRKLKVRDGRIPAADTSGTPRKCEVSREGCD